jgi:hypothetical protein
MLSTGSNMQLPRLTVSFEKTAFRPALEDS